MYPNIKENIEIIRLLENGGTATVYEAYDHWAQRRVAIKALYQSVFKDVYIRKKFKQEANIYLQLAHPNIVQLMDFISTDNTDYLVMEYVDGFTLNDYINNISGPLVDERLIAVFTQALKGFAHAHHHGIFHLDIKPDNIMIDKSGIVKILDFGISTIKSANDDNDRMMGTPMFMSPEQVNKASVNRLSDIYSLGVTLFYAITARLPYGQIDIVELFEKIRNEKLPRIKEFYPFANKSLQAIVDRATDKNPDKRFQSCEEFEYEMQSII
jgi:serine/threonine-protein kinase